MKTITPQMHPFTAAIVLIFCTNLAAAPGAPQIDWMVTEFALISVDSGAVAYADLVDIRDQVEVPVRWSRWSGQSATRVEYRLDGAPVLSESLAATASQSGTATLVVDRGGRYRLSVALCDAEDCTESAPVEITVADTDGSHLPPLQPNAGGRNRAYDNVSGRVVASTFVEWGVYARQFPVDRIPAYNLTHLFYGFIPICGGDGINDALKQMSAQSYAGLQRACAGTRDFEVAIADPWAALQKPQQGHVWSTTYKGNFGQLMALKNAYPELKIVPSVGGWSLSDPFYSMDDPLIRQRFVASVERFLRTWKFFDGVDIDWEYPGGQGANPALGNPGTDGETYVALLRELRAMLDRIAAETGREFILTSAVSADPRKIGLIDYRAASEPLDLILAMTYDFHGAWSLSDLGHHTALYAPEFDPSDTFNASTGIEALIGQGADPAKLGLGVAMYGRGWSGVHGYRGSPFTGAATGPIAGTWEPGGLDYRDIAANKLGGAWQYGYDHQAEAPYVFNPGTGDLATFDDPTSVRAKGAYVDQLGLAGLFSWEIDADNGDILNAMHEGLGHPVVGAENRAPQADAGADQRLEVHLQGPLQVGLDGTRSHDSDGDDLSYRWRQLAGPVVALRDAAMARANFEADIDLAGAILDFELQVSDGAAWASDRVTIALVAPTINQAPVVQLPTDLRLAGGATDRLTASATDPDGDPLTYAWQVPEALQASGLDQATLTLHAPTLVSAADYRVQVTVSDGVLSASAITRVSVDADPGGRSERCLTADPHADAYPAWDAGTVYISGDTISYDALVWRAKYWTQGNPPGIGADPWKLTSDVELGWSPEKVFLGGDQTDHQRRRWQAHWWTRGEEPGVAGVWTDIGPALCP